MSIRASGEHRAGDDRSRDRQLPADSPEVVVLGASNVTRNLSLIVSSLRAAFPDGVRLFIAHGHGRSYGVTSRALWRQLDGHVDSALWPAWHTHGRQSSRRYALITDVGNDLLYGPDVNTILGWVGQCVSRLKADGCEVAVATLPVETLAGLSKWRYEATSRLFFPKHATPWETMRQNIFDLDAGLRVLAQGAGATTVDPDPKWYGFDPIHFRFKDRHDAVTKLLSGWPGRGPVQSVGGGPAEAMRLWTSRPARKWIAGQRVDTPQPIRQDERHELWLF